VTPSTKTRPCFPAAKAPAKILAEKTQAMVEQHGKAFAKSSMQSLGMNLKNATWPNRHSSETLQGDNT